MNKPLRIKTVYPKSNDKPSWVNYSPSLSELDLFWNNIDWSLITFYIKK
jgi:hypothetical protein